MAALNSQQHVFSLKQCALFVHAAASRNQRAVAQALFMSTASVSRTLIDLENALKTPLFDRPHGISRLTDSGQVFLEHAQRILQCQVNMLRVTNDSKGDEKSLAQRAMRINLPQLRALISINEAGSFSSAARVSLTSQSSLSRSVRDLEEALSTHLVERTAAGIKLTKVGNRVLPLAIEMLVLCAEAWSAMALRREKSPCKLTVAGSLSVMPSITPSLLQSLSAEFPHHQIDLKSELSERVEEAVCKGEAIFGLCGVVQEKPQFVYTHLLEVQLGIIWSPKMPFPESINCLDDLAHIPFVRFYDKALITEALLDVECNLEAYFNSRVTVSSIEPGLDVVQGGKCAMLITGIGAERQLARGLRFLPLPNLLPSIKVSMIQKRGRLFDELQQRATEKLIECVTKLPWHDSIKVFRRAHP